MKNTSSDNRSFTKEKRAWAKAHVTRWTLDLKNEEFEKVEKIRNEAGLTRVEFLRMLITEKYGENTL